MAEGDDKLRSLRNKVWKDREQRFLLHFPIFASLEKEERNFFLQMAAISATIGSFSFFIFDKVKTQIFLLCGDLVLGIVIIISVSMFLVRYVTNFRSTSDAYHNLFERDSDQISTIDQYFRRENSKQDVDDFFVKLLNTVQSYERPKISSFSMNKLVAALFAFAIILILFSFFVRI